MNDTLGDLTLDLLEWLDAGPRPYAEVLDAWRTSCPRLPVWENANDQGFIERRHVAGSGTFVSLSVAGAEHLRTCRGVDLLRRGGLPDGAHLAHG